jgi:hypothetical protein
MKEMPFQSFVLDFPLYQQPYDNLGRFGLNEREDFRTCATHPDPLQLIK